MTRPSTDAYTTSHHPALPKPLNCAFAPKPKKVTMTTEARLLVSHSGIGFPIPITITH